MLLNHSIRRVIIAMAVLCYFSNSASGQLPFTGRCDFEPVENCDFIAIDTSAENTWIVAKPQKVFFDSAYSKEHAILTDSVNPYPPNNYSYFEIPVTITYHNVAIDFWHKFDTDTLTDGGYISISYDTGATWHNVLDIAKQIDTHFTGGMHYYTGAVYTDSSLLFNGEKGFSGNSGGWVKSTFDIHWTLPMSIENFHGYGNIIIRFNFISDSVDNGKEGWMIDSLKVIESLIGNTNTINSEPISLYPNPSKGIVHLQLKKSMAVNTCRYTISDLTGRVLDTKPIIRDQQQLDVSPYGKGIYIITVFEHGVPIGISKLVVM